MIVLVGKTCSGKDSIKKELINLGMKNIVTYTTRPLRNGEVNGVDYHFIDIDTFRRGLAIQSAAIEGEPAKSRSFFL